MFLAHSANGRGAGVAESLAEHLTLVAERAAGFADVFGARAEARAAGLLHDVGKYSPRFLERLAGRESGLDHWTPGAVLAYRKYGVAGTAGAVAILGHHVGLQSASNLRAQLKAALRDGSRKLTETDPSVIEARLAADRVAPPERVEASLYDPRGRALAGMLDIRMLFSALVDADFVETEAHFRGDERERRRYRPEGPRLDSARALPLVLEHVGQLEERTRASRRMRDLRAALLQACLDGASGAPGLFTLSAPTGAGKTLAMLAFALRHAELYGLRRVVVVIPYLSLIEQTVQVYRGVLSSRFGPHYVIEDHSLAMGRAQSGAGGGDLPDDAGEANAVARLLAENWDAPIIVTTSVQCLESLFAHRPSVCRKLHRLARSVLLFDEVQTLPPSLAVATVAALSHLAARYGATVVFATATQPAFDHLDAQVRQFASAGWRPRELVPAPHGLFAESRRVRVAWRVGAKERIGWEQLAEELASAENERVLCVVNLKRHAATLASLLQGRGAPGLCHLSTNMCPAHRAAVLERVRASLAAAGGVPCRLVSTQCVEAGVDVDFPVVYRALGPLDAIAQAAGRCNREDALERAGLVTVFVPEDEAYPQGWYSQATGATRAYLELLADEESSLDASTVIDDPERLRAYYRALYDISAVGAMEDRNGRRLRDALEARDFKVVAERYRIIDQDTISVVVPFDLDAYHGLRQRVVREGRITREWILEARPHAVSVYRPRPDDSSGVWNCLDPVGGDRQRGGDHGAAEWFFLVGAQLRELYDKEVLGLRALDGQWVA